MGKNYRLVSFVVLGIMLFSALILVFALRISMDSRHDNVSLEHENTSPIVSIESNFSLNRREVQNYIESEIKHTIDQGVFKSGFGVLSGYIDENLAGNLDLGQFSESYNIGGVNSTLIVSENESFMSVIVKVPIEVGEGDDSVNFSGFFLEYSLISDNIIYIGNDGVAHSDSLIYSEYNNTMLNVSDGVSLVNSNGDSIRRIIIAVEDVEPVELTSFFVFNTIKVRPEGACFSESVELEMGYNSTLVPDGFSEEDIKMVQIMEDGSFNFLDSVVDSDDNFVVGSVNCSGRYALVVRIEEEEVVPDAPVSVVEEDVPDAPVSCGENVVDVEGNSYSSVKIGNQCWMGENMRTTKYPDGSSISKGMPHDRVYSDAIPVHEVDHGEYFCPTLLSYSVSGQDCDVAKKLGMLYQWSAAMAGSRIEGAQGICPNGWHIPTLEELHVLELFLTDNVSSCKEIDYTNPVHSYSCDSVGAKLAGNITGDEAWRNSIINSDGFGSSGFNAPPSGCIDNYGSSVKRCCSAEYWFSTELDSTYAMWIHIGDIEYLYRIGRGYMPKARGVSVRCIKDSD